MKPTVYSDIQLTAYLDNELEPTEHATLGQALTQDPALRQRLQALELNQTEMKAAFDALLAETPAAPNLTETAVHHRSYRGLQSIAAAMILAIGLVGGWFLHDYDRTQPWHQSVAEYQALYINRTLNHIVATPSQQQIELKRVGTVLGRALPLNTLTALSDLDYKRAQVLGFEGKPLIQLAFLSKLDTPVALCVIKTQKQHATSGIRVKTIKGMAAASWAQKGYAYLLIGGQDKRLIADQAEHFATHL